MKRKIILAAAAAVASLTSCNKEIIPDIQDSSESSTEIVVRVPQIATKASSTLADNENSVKTLQVYVFNSNGTKLESYASTTGTEATVKVAVGDKMIAAVVNAASITDATSLAVLKNKVSMLTDNSTAGGFVMFGETTKTVTSGSTVDVAVSRLVARVVLSKITNKIDLPQYQNETMKIKGVYLVNAVGKTNLGSSYDPQASDYLNKKVRENGTPTLLGGLFSQAAPVALNGSYSTQTRMYSCPNNASSDSQADAWSKRFTRVVVEVEFAGETWYYPITLDRGLQASYSYEIPELVITRLGSTSPDLPLVIGSVTYKISVNPWTLTDMGTVTI